MFAPGDPTNTPGAPGSNVAQLIAALMGQGQGSPLGSVPAGFQSALGGLLGGGMTPYQQGDPAGMANILNTLFSRISPGQGKTFDAQGKAFAGGRTDAGGDMLRGNPNGSGSPRGFAWGNRTWGPNDFGAFANYLRSRGVDIAQWARAHPAAFASFNIDPRIQQTIAATWNTQGQMPHA